MSQCKFSVCLRGGLIAMVLFLGNACTQEYIEPDSGICFEQDILPVFISNCTQSGCHNSIDREEGYDFTSYEKIVSRGIVAGNYKASEVYKVLVKPFGEERMPPAPNEMLSVRNIQNIALWIDEGAKLTTCAPAACDTAAISYALHVQPLMQTWCNGCHSSGAPSGSIATDNYPGLKSIADNGSLIGSVAHDTNYEPMPQNSDPLSACDVGLLQQWVADGAPEN